MALFFDIEKLESESGNDLKKFMALLKYHYTGQLPTKKEKYKPIRLPGHSFLLNPGPLFKIVDVDIAFIVQYIKLAGRRDYTLYKMHNYAKLDLSYFPDVIQSVYKQNPLLRQDKNELRFKYEEIYLKDKQQWH